MHQPSCRTRKLLGRTLLAGLVGLSLGACGAIETETGAPESDPATGLERLPNTGGGTASEAEVPAQPDAELPARCRATSVRLYYSGVARPLERQTPLQVSLCLAGGTTGSAVSYTEEAEAREQRLRTVHYAYDGERGRAIGLPRDPLAVGFDLERTFGADPSRALDSAELRHEGQIPAGHQAVYYRQTTQLERVAQIVAHTSCGVKVPLGHLKLTDWTFAVDLATGESCPPPTRLPPAQKFTAHIQ